MADYILIITGIITTLSIVEQVFIMGTTGVLLITPTILIPLTITILIHTIVITLMDITITTTIHQITPTTIITIPSTQQDTEDLYPHILTVEV